MVVDAAKRFLRNNSGTTAVIFGLAMLPITIGVGAAIDYSRAANARAEMQTAVDAAALGAAREGGKLDDAGLSTLGRDFFDANFKSRDSVNVSTMSVARSGRTIKVAAKGGVDTSIMQLMGIRTVDIAADAQVGWGNNTVELALVLDNTGSMAQSGKLPALKQAVNNLLDVLEKSAPEPGSFKVSIVPFTTQVNVGAASRSADWLGFQPCGHQPVVARRHGRLGRMSSSIVTSPTTSTPRRASAAIRARSTRQSSAPNPVLRN